MTQRLALIAALLLAACKASDGPPEPDAGDACAVLFGRPNEQTGLGADQCKPSCACAAPPFVEPTYDAAFIRALVDEWQLASPNPPLSSDPYASPPPAEDPYDTVCAVVPRGDPGAKPRAYDLATFASEADARAAGAKPTHFGRCGACSPLVDLAVYMRENDLTAPVRSCGLLPKNDAGTQIVDCLLGLGFDLPCAQIWAYNTAHTRDACFAICIANLRYPYNLEDGSLNPCLQCDEDNSGRVFKAIAGRTRRNTGLANAICRPCAQVRPLVHAY